MVFTRSLQNSNLNLLFCCLHFPKSSFKRSQLTPAFLVHFQTLCLRRAHKRFSFRNFSLGNGFLTGARDLFSSLPSAIFLFKAIAGVDQTVAVIPVINTNQTITIAAHLKNGNTLVGQCSISHPTSSKMVITSCSSPSRTATPLRDELEIPTLDPNTEAYGDSLNPTDNRNGLSEERSPFETNIHQERKVEGERNMSLCLSTEEGVKKLVEEVVRWKFSDGKSIGQERLNGLNGLRRDSRTFDTHVPPSPIERVTISVGGGIEAPELVITEEEGLDDNVGYMKGEKENPLEAPVERVYYINLYGQEIYPEPNPDFLSAINQRDILVYSCGSLWTSIIPCLALRGLGMAIATSSSLKAKVLLLNSKNDRETPHYKASDYVKTILTTLRTYDRPTRSPSTWEAGRLLTHLVYLVGGEVEVDRDEIEEMGVKLVCVPREIHGKDNMFTVEAVEWAMSRCL
ncbi:hypothetical protein M231_06653 [Tremella mesenterica]|uniref:Uncharacterized protein n=1 Tax=Tremella mesenterica TaxID=5217 RepID=A0A4Q1BF07_TREME|nr:hypothetical protein M231_06653 [Tremella mesenterica]